MSDPLRDSFDGLEQAFERLHLNEDVIRSTYQGAPREWLRRALVVEYRCPNKRGCLLLHAWRGGVNQTYFYIPPYKMSPTRNARESVESARKKNTLDGNRVWRPRAGVLDDLLEWGDAIGLAVQCDHLAARTVTPGDIIRDAARSTAGKPTRRIIAARFA